MYRDQLSVLYRNRHCYQEDVDEIVFRNNYCFYSYFEGRHRLSFFKIETALSSKLNHNELKLGLNTYAVNQAGIGEYLKFRGIIPKNVSDSLNKLLDKRQYFCVCIFMKELYVLGGYCDGSTNSCLKYSFTHNKWNDISNMNERRSSAACTVFEGKIVVSGGDVYDEVLNSVEAYDHYGKKWTYLPDMIESRFEHSSVSLSNKLFVIGGDNHNTSEVFDSVNRKFSYIKIDIFSSALRFSWKSGACCVGDKIILVCVTRGRAYTSVVYHTNNK